MNPNQIEQKVKKNEQIIFDKEKEEKMLNLSINDIEQEILIAVDSDKKELVDRLNNINNRIYDIKSELNFYYSFNYSLLTSLLDNSILQLQKDAEDFLTVKTKKVNFALTPEQQLVEKLNLEINEIRKRINTLLKIEKRTQNSNDISDIKEKINNLKEEIKNIRREKEKQTQELARE